MILSFMMADVGCNEGRLIVSHLFSFFESRVRIVVFYLKLKGKFNYRILYLVYWLLLTLC